MAQAQGGISEMSGSREYSNREPERRLEKTPQSEMSEAKGLGPESEYLALPPEKINEKLEKTPNVELPEAKGLGLESEYLDPSPEKVNEFNESNKQIYQDGGVDTEHPRIRQLSGKEYETCEVKDIDPNQELDDGTTNRVRMEQKLAPYVLRDGQLVKVELHHHKQQDQGPLVELDEKTHSEKHQSLHPQNGKGEGRGDDPLWNQRRGEYWQQRAAEYSV